MSRIMIPQLIGQEEFFSYARSNIEIAANVYMGSDHDPNHEFVKWQGMFTHIAENIATVKQNPKSSLVTRGYLAILNNDEQNHYLGQIFVNDFSEGLISEDPESKISNFLTLEGIAERSAKKHLTKQLDTPEDNILMHPTFYMFGEMDRYIVSAHEMEDIDEFNPNMLKKIGHVHTDGPFAKYFPGKFDSSNVMKVVDYDKMFGKK